MPGVRVGITLAMHAGAGAGDSFQGGPRSEETATSGPHWNAVRLVRKRETLVVALGVRGARATLSKRSRKRSQTARWAASGAARNFFFQSAPGVECALLTVLDFTLR
jgi:hypothetical protein